MTATRSHIVRGFTATLLARAIYMGSTAVLMLVLARYLLSPDAYGSLFWVIGILSVVQLAADLGIGKAAARYLAEYRTRDPGQIPHLLRATVSYKLVVLAVVAGALLVAHDPLAAALGEPSVAPFFAVGAVYVVANSFAGFSQVALQGFNRLEYSAAVQSGTAVVRTAVAIALAAAGLGALGAFLGYVAGAAVGAAIGLGVLYVKFYRTHEAAPRFEPGLPRRLLEYSVPLTATRSANVLDKQIDIVLVGAILNPAAVAFYTLAKQITDFALAPADSLGFALSPNFGEGKAAGDVAEIRTLYRTALEHTLLLYVPAATGLAIVAGPFVSLVVGADYADAVPVLRVLAAFVVLQAITNVTSDGLDYLGRARSRAIAKGATSVANFVLNLLLIPTVGIVGAAAATVVTHTIYVAINLRIVHAELSLPVREIAHSVVTIGAITLAMAIAVTLVAPMISGPITLASAVALGGAVWAVLAVGSGLVDPGVVRRTLASV
ncbi:flippase [Saliphagus sp. LR7]|uniref:flippase n=1 Tax=Saliphagus sp. LR7 TaxID=2282654 RepID=UPI000DF7AE95|nr:flippase [Saliphagus sp. LR7]